MYQTRYPNVIAEIFHFFDAITMVRSRDPYLCAVACHEVLQIRCVGTETPTPNVLRDMIHALVPLSDAITPSKTF